MKRVIWLLVCLIFMITASGCSSESVIKEINSILHKPSAEAVEIYSGKWVLSVISNKTIKGRILDPKALDMSELPYIILNSDGTASIHGLDNDGSGITWWESESGITLDGQEIIFDDGMLCIVPDDESVTMYFEKENSNNGSSTAVKEDTPQTYKKVSDYVGTWTPVSIKSSLWQAEFTDAADVGLDDFYIILQKDYVAHVNIYGERIKTTWKKNSKGILLNYGKMQLVADGDKLAARLEDKVLYFAKASDETEFSIDSKDSISKDSNISEDTIRPEFKAMMDQYEAFFDDYIAFMQNYMSTSSSNPTAIFGMLQDYLDWLEKYSKVMEEFKNVGDSKMTRAEAFYYAEVSLRIEEKLLKAME